MFVLLLRWSVYFRVEINEVSRAYMPPRFSRQSVASPRLRGVIAISLYTKYTTLILTTNQMFNRKGFNLIYRRKKNTASFEYLIRI